MKVYKIIIGIVIFVISLFCFWFFYLRNVQENELMKEGNLIVEKIEQYKLKYYRLPNTLTEIGVVEKDESDTPFYYDKRDSTHYALSFSISFDDYKIYFSDSKKWEDSDRKMK